jgi:hypothetical protein
MKSPNLQEISFTGFRSHASGVSMCLHDGGHLKIYYDLVAFLIL